MKTELIQKEIVKGRQVILYKEILKLGEHKIKVFIESNSYKFQCQAKVSIFKDMEWKVVASIHYSKMSTPEKLFYADDYNDEKYFKQDREKLLILAKSIIY